jgi:hypothetical protein
MSIMVPPRSVRLHWDHQAGWILDVPWMMPDDFVKKTIDYAIPRQIDRWRSLPPGSKKDDLEASIKLLQQHKVTQKIVGARGDGKGDIIIHSGMKGN